MLFKQKEDCCACEACANICSKNAISIKEDENGFRYPLIDNTICIDCGLCQKVCAFQNIEETNHPLKTYVAAAVDKKVIRKSASGGIFAVLAKEIISKGGYVCGATLFTTDEKVCVEHIIIDKVEEIGLLQGSKYVQSNIGDCFKLIKKLLNEGKVVMFSGTPCQCAGLKAFLRKPYENLIIIDIICHGVPNQKLFNDYLAYKYSRKEKITNFAFRDKSKGWGLLGRVDYKNGKSQTVPAGLSSFYSFFLDSQIYRENCYKCKYASQNRPGDLTLGDYWGIEREHPELITSKKYNPEDGISCIVVNTPKGADILKNISDSIIMDCSTYEKIANRNKQLLQPSNRGKHYDEIFDAYRMSGYKAVDKIFYKYYKKQILIHSIFSKLPFGLKERIRKLLK